MRRPPVLIQPGVTLAGVPVGGMSNEQAQAALRPAFAKPVRLVYGDRRWRLQPTRFGGQVTIADGVLQALGAQAGAAVPLVPEVDDQEVRRFVNALDKRVSTAARGRGAQGSQGPAPAVREGEGGRQGSARADRPAHRARAAVASAAAHPCCREGARARADRRQLRCRHRHSARQERAALLPGRAADAEVRRRDRSVGVSDADRDVQHRRHATNPWWLPPDSPWAAGKKPIPPGPGNPLGTRWMGLSAPGVGIHGTPDDASIGYSASHGCIRMHIPDAEWLFHHVKLGTPVVITDR